MAYDSTQDTLTHINRVRQLLDCVRDILYVRGTVHDQTKLLPPEKELFDEYTPILKDLNYGSIEYFESLKKLEPATEHHYSKNSHHPQHFENGIDGMDLFDVIEMLVDWKAAGERTESGNITQSLMYNKDRFKISDQLYSILINTIKRNSFL